MDAQIEVGAVGPGDLEQLQTWMNLEDLRYFHRRVARPGSGSVVIARSGGVAVGALVVSWDVADEPQVRERLAGVPIIFRLRVAARFRRQGVATALVRQAESMVRKRGHAHVLVGVDRRNFAARALYGRLGYELRTDLTGIRGVQGPYDIFVADLRGPIDS